MKNLQRFTYVYSCTWVYIIGLYICYHPRQSTWREHLYVREVKLRETFCMHKSNESYKQFQIKNKCLSRQQLNIELFWNFHINVTRAARFGALAAKFSSLVWDRAKGLVWHVGMW